MNRESTAEFITELTLTLATAHQEEISILQCDVFNPKTVTNMTFTLKEIVTRIGKQLKCENYAEDVMDMVLSYAKAVNDAGGRIKGTEQIQTLGEIFTQLAHNGIRFHHEKPVIPPHEEETNPYGSYPHPPENGTEQTVDAPAKNAATSTGTTHSPKTSTGNQPFMNVLWNE